MTVTSEILNKLLTITPFGGYITNNAITFGNKNIPNTKTLLTQIYLIY